MTVVFLFLLLATGLVTLFFVMRPKYLMGLELPQSTTPEGAAFNLSNTLLLVGPRPNDPDCSEQRRELKRILPYLLERKYKIVEIYGEQPPSENGQALDWLDNQLLRKTFNAEEYFHLIFVDDRGRTHFHSSRIVVAEALFHVLSLEEDMIPEPAEQKMVKSKTDVSEPPSASSETAKIYQYPPERINLR